MLTLEPDIYQLFIMFCSACANLNVSHHGNSLLSPPEGVGFSGRRDSNLVSQARQSCSAPHSETCDETNSFTVWSRFYLNFSQLVIASVCSKTWQKFIKWVITADKAYLLVDFHIVDHWFAHDDFFTSVFLDAQSTVQVVVVYSLSFTKWLFYC